MSHRTIRAITWPPPLLGYLKGDQGYSQPFWGFEWASGKQAAWNNLPKEVVEAETIDAFKNALDEYWKDDPMKFDHLSLRRASEEEEWIKKERFVEVFKGLRIFDFWNI